MRTPRFAAVVLAAVAAVLSLPKAADAALAYGLLANPTSPDGNSQLVTFDTASPGSATVVGDTGLNADDVFINGLAFDGAGNLFASNLETSNYLYSVNPTTGAATAVGGGTVPNGQRIGDLGFDRANNRMLAVTFSSSPNVAPRLATVNTASGALGDLGAITGINDGTEVSLGVANNGTVFIHGITTDRWYRVDPATLVATPLAQLPINTNTGQGGDVDPESNTLFHAAYDQGAATSKLYSIDMTTGAAALRGNIGTNLSTVGVQLGDIAFNTVPEPTTLVAAAGAASLLLARRRR